MNFVIYDKRISNENLPSYRIEQNSNVYLDMLQDKDSENSNKPEDIKMLEYEDKHPITYIKDDIKIESLKYYCTAALIDYPINQECFKYGDKVYKKYFYSLLIILFFLKNMFMVCNKL